MYYNESLRIYNFFRKYPATSKENKIATQIRNLRGY